MSIQLHVLKLFEPAVVDGNYDRFRMMWLIDDGLGKSVPKISDSDRSQSCSSDTSEQICEGTAANDSWKGIEYGDLIYFPELLTGAGEFEGLRFAGERSAELTDNYIPLLVPGIEGVQFPPDIALRAEEIKVSLRSLYEQPLQDVLSMQAGSLTLEDMFGGSDVVEEFWSKPDIYRRRTPLKSEDDKWIIPLSECTLISTKVYDN